MKTGISKIIILIIISISSGCSNMSPQVTDEFINDIKNTVEIHSKRECEKINDNFEKENCTQETEKSYSY